MAPAGVHVPDELGDVVDLSRSPKGVLSNLHGPPAQQALEAYIAMPASVLATNDTGPAYSGTVETLGPDLANGLSGQYQREFMIDADATAATIGVYTISVRVTWTGARGTSENVVLQSFRAGA